MSCLGKIDLSTARPVRRSILGQTVGEAVSANINTAQTNGPAQASTPPLPGGTSTPSNASAYGQYLAQYGTSLQDSTSGLTAAYDIAALSPEQEGWAPADLVNGTPVQVNGYSAHQAYFFSDGGAWNGSYGLTPTLTGANSTNLGSIDTSIQSVPPTPSPVLAPAFVPPSDLDTSAPDIAYGPGDTATINTASPNWIGSNSTTQNPYLIQIQGPGSNGGPPLEDNFPEIVPRYEEVGPNAPRVPQGWDIPGQTVGGLYYPPTRNPVLPNGTPWPIANHENVLSILSTNTRGMPRMLVYVPRDKIGPILVGSTPLHDFIPPKGYDAVILIGRPQATNSGGQQTGHAYDSVNEALRLASSNKFSIIYFNRRWSTINGELFKSLIRPDVVAVARPEVNLPYRFYPYESLSPGQTLVERQPAMPNVPYIAPLRGQQY